VTGNDLIVLREEVAFGEVQVGAADATDTDPEPNLTSPGNRVLSFNEGERMSIDRSRSVAHHPCLHGWSRPLADEAMSETDTIIVFPTIASRRT
jgi:hypothetical protein